MAVFAKANVRTVEDLEAWLKSARKYKVLSTVTDRYTPIDIFNELANREAATYYSRGSLHTGHGRYRSLYDIILTSKHHNPDKSYKDILLEVCNHYYESIRAVVPGETPWNMFPRSFNYCSTVRKHNFRGAVYSVERRTWDNFVMRFEIDLKINFPNIQIDTVDELGSIVDGIWKEEVTIPQ